MKQFVELCARRNRGWPWPERSWGLTPMFGADGWCPSCGVPRNVQTGSLVLQGKGIKPIGAWIPNWQFDAICLADDLAVQVDRLFKLDLRNVLFKGSNLDCAKQIVVPSVGKNWFDKDELREKAKKQHGIAGRSCPECGLWRWMPLGFDTLPPIRNLSRPELEEVDIAASPEWFGDGWKAFRQIVVRRELAELIVKASPLDFRIQELDLL